MISRRFPKPCRFPEELESEGLPDLLLVNSTSGSTNLWSSKLVSLNGEFAIDLPTSNVASTQTT